MRNRKDSIESLISSIGIGPQPVHLDLGPDKTHRPVEENEELKDTWNTLSTKIGRDWRRLGRELGYSDGELDTLTKDYQNEGQQEVVHQMLVKWRDKTPQNAVIRKLKEALEAVERRDLIEHVKDGSHKRRLTMSRSVSIPDRYSHLDDIKKDLIKEDLESCNLIIGIDFTKSNENNGRKTFNGNNLHHIEGGHLNFYEKAILAIGTSVSKLDEDGKFVAYRFGDLKTKAHTVIPIKEEDGGYCTGVSDVLKHYRRATKTVTMSGPTCFSPLIKKAIEIVSERLEYHILLILADGQITTNSSANHPTLDALVEASEWPLSIIMIGIGDGPWDQMKEFDDGLKQRKFDNFQFVNFCEIMEKCKDEDWQDDFSLHTLMEIPDQFKEIKRLGLLTKRDN